MYEELERYSFYDKIESEYDEQNEDDEIWPITLEKRDDFFVCKGLFCLEY